MRIIDVCDSAIETVAVSPDGRYVGASAKDAFGVFHWTTGEAVLHTSGGCDQIAFAIDSRWVMRGRSVPLIDILTNSAPRPPTFRGGFVGGLAVSPDGRMLVATESSSGGSTKAALVRWALPGFQELRGYDDWAPLRRLAFSPNGQFLGGLWPGYAAGWRTESAVFELRYAASGGGDYRYRPHDRRAFPSLGFVSFTRDNSTCAFGWEDEFHVLDISTGTSRYVRRVEASFRDAAFTGSGHLFGTVDEDGRLKLWDVKTWQVMREYDWQCGALTSLAFTADGSAGVCGTADGRLVQFDVDE